MSITLITGVPGSGKSLYGVSKILAPLVGTSEKKTGDNGVEIEIPRVIYTNVNGLQLDHVPIEGGGTWEYANKVWKYDGNDQGLRGWHTWAKPGAFICFDEFQKFWPPRPAGSAVPPDIQALDTHRHMGVDFLLITQNCNNVDRHILGLVDRHLHVRRVANMPFATVYEWDHCSKTLQYKNAMAKSAWRYDKSAFKLYKSAELHTKQRRKVPAVLWFILAGLIGAGVGIPMVQARISDRVHGGSSAKSAPATAPGKKTDAAKVEYRDGMKVETVSSTSSGPPDGYVPPAPAAPASAAFSPAPAPVLAGCIVVRERCGCFDQKGLKVPAELAQCKVDAGLSDAPRAVVLDDARPRDSAADAEILAFMKEQRRGSAAVPLLASLSSIR